MDQRTDPAVVWARAVLVAVVTVFLGVVGHVTADGLLPGPMVLVPLLTFTVGSCAPLLNGRATRLRIVTLLVGGQAFVHVVLTLTAGHGEDRDPALPVGHLVEDLSAHAPMMVVHMLAAALVGLWLAAGERCLWALLALATRFVVVPLLLIGALLRSGTPTIPRLVRRSAGPAGLRTPDLLARSVVRRGPPALLAA